MLDSNPWYLLVDSVTISLNVQALRTSDDASNPVYVSVGHKVSLETATQLVIACSKKRVPEPVRQVLLPCTHRL